MSKNEKTQEDMKKEIKKKIPNLLIITTVILAVVMIVAMGIAILGINSQNSTNGMENESKKRVGSEEIDNTQLETEINLVDVDAGEEEPAGQYGLIGNRFICKEIPETAKNSGAKFDDGSKGFEEGHYTLMTGGWSYFGENEVVIEIRRDVYLCYDGSAWDSGEWYDVYSTSGVYIGSAYDKKRM